MPKVIAHALPRGVTSPTDLFKSEAEITDNIEAHSDVIGRVVTQATEKAWFAGHDPALDPFVVVVTFR